MFGQVVVEEHADRTHQQASGRLNDKMALADLDQSVCGHLFQHRPGLGEVMAEFDGMIVFDSGEAELEITDERLDDVAADQIVLIAAQPLAVAS